MGAITIAGPCAGGAILPSQVSEFISLHPLSDHQYGLQRWKPIRLRIEIARTRKPSVRANAKAASEGGVMPYEASVIGREYYLDELDVVTLLDPPKELIPLDPSSYNPASYLWKKIEDVPEERRHHFLSHLTPRLRSRAWEVAGRRYDDPKLAKKSASTLLYSGDSASSKELWRCRTSGTPIQTAWINSSQKAIFSCTDEKVYGRLIGVFPLSGVMNSSPLYFSVKQVSEVMSTEEHCDFAYEFGDGLLSLPEYPQGFPKPSKHPWPFNDQVVIYVRHLGPGVMVGQVWQEGVSLQQVPKKLCNEMLMVKDYFSSSNDK